MNVLGTQFGIEFNANQLLFTGVSGGAFDIKSHHYNPFHVSNGKLSFSYDVAEGKALKAEEVLFTIEFKALLSGNTQNIRLDHSTLNRRFMKQMDLYTICLSNPEIKISIAVKISSTKMNQIHSKSQQTFLLNWQKVNL
jgi:hypothetical protein